VDFEEEFKVHLKAQRTALDMMQKLLEKEIRRKPKDFHSIKTLIEAIEIKTEVYYQLCTISQLLKGENLLLLNILKNWSVK
jgi:hypothetical protein